MQMPSSTGKSYSCFPVEQLKKGSTSILKDKIQISYAFLICSKIINIKKKLHLPSEMLGEKGLNTVTLSISVNAHKKSQKIGFFKL